MSSRYIDLIEQVFYFPQEGFKVQKNLLEFYNIPLMKLVETYGTPLRITFLPKISSQIQKAKTLFSNAFEQHKYKGNYFYSYCTKSNHFSFVLEEALKNDIHLETSSEFDIDLVRKLYEKDLITKQTFIICNGFKTERYKKKITELINSGFVNLIPVLDNKQEFDYYQANVTAKKVRLGIRMAAEEEPNFEFYTSRLGIRYRDIAEFFENKIKPDSRFEFSMLHFFINTGIKDTAYYWSELNRALEKYCDLRSRCKTLKFLNIGGGLPIRYSLGFDYDYQYMISEIVRLIKKECREWKVPTPDIFTEFGNFSVGESGIHLFSVVGQKQQNDSELWYMIDGSLMTTMPDIWGLNQRFITLPVNLWNNEYHRANIGGLSCDIHDYYNSEMHIGQFYLPKIKKGQKLVIGFFHTGAYQESLSGFGGVKHCLIPAPQYIIISQDEKGRFHSRRFSDEQKPESMLQILGY